MVQQLRTVIPVDDLFVRVAADGRAPGVRFRFAEPCAGAACAHHDGSICTLVERLAPARAESANGQDLRPCPIRRDCVWFAQAGASACTVCPSVVRTASTTTPEGDTT